MQATLPWRRRLRSADGGRASGRRGSRTPSTQKATKDSEIRDVVHEEEGFERCVGGRRGSDEGREVEMRKLGLQRAQSGSSC